MSKKVNYSQLLTYLVEVYILLSFILIGQSEMLIYILVFSIPIFILMHKKVVKPTYFPVIAIVYSLAVYVYYNYLGNGHTQGLQLINVLLISFILIYLENYKISQPDKSIDVFYCVGIVFIIASMIIGNRADEGSIILYGFSDKNYSAVFVFLFFLYTSKRGKYLGTVVGLSYLLIFTNSRSMTLMFVLFYIVWIFRDKIWSVLEKHKITFGKMLITLFIAVIIFSFFWVYFISASGVSSSHYGSLNDSSNQMRFAGIVYTFTLILNNWKNLLFGGYGADYASVLGIDTTFNLLPTFMGIKLTQAHNSVLNNVATMGILPTGIYYVLLCKVVQKFMTKESLPYILPYLVNAMLMHSLFDNRFLVFWLYILSISQGDFKKNKIRIVLSKKSLKGKINRKDNINAYT